jgi:hypothetical protein
VLDADDRDGELAVDVGDERLEDRGRVEAERLRRLEPVRLVLGVVLVGVRPDRELRPFERLRRGCRLAAQAMTFARVATT